MIRDLIHLPLNELQKEAFRLRMLHFSKKLTFSIPDTISYNDSSICIKKNSFPAISITGTRCELRCEHCRGMLLKSMIPAETPQSLYKIVEELVINGASGILLSGGANQNGEVPLGKFIPTIRKIKERFPHFKIIVHTGLIRAEIGRELKSAGIDQILIDVIGDDETIKEVYHLDKRVIDYENTLWMLKEMGHKLAPHIIIGHYFGEIRGEWRALEIVSNIEVETIVLVILKPLSRINPWKIPVTEEVAKITAIARILNPRTHITMGCIRPSNSNKIKMEIGAIDSGINAVTFPLQSTIEYAQSVGFEIYFMSMCCSLISCL